MDEQKLIATLSFLHSVKTYWTGEIDMSDQNIAEIEVAHARHVVEDVIEERTYQINKFGGAAVDDKNNGIADWVMYIVQYAAKTGTNEFGHKWPDTNALKAFRQSMVKVAALAVAAAQWADRKIGDPIGE